MSDSIRRHDARAVASMRAAHQGISDNIQSLAEVRQELEMLRRVVRTMVYAQVSGEALALHEDPVSTWLGLPVGATPEQAMERLLRTQAKVVGTSACPSCGAQIQDLEGIANEQCQWCGARLEQEG